MSALFEVSGESFDIDIFLNQYRPIFNLDWELWYKGDRLFGRLTGPGNGALFLVSEAEGFEGQLSAAIEFLTLHSTLIPQIVAYSEAQKVCLHFVGSVKEHEALPCLPPNFIRLAADTGISVRIEYLSPAILINGEMVDPTLPLFALHSIRFELLKRSQQ